MKTISIIIIALMVSVFSFGQTPRTFKYQAIARDASNQVLSNKTVNLKISIVSESENGPIVYSETHMPTTNANGLLNLEIGAGNPVSGSFNDISWGTAAHYVKIEMDADGGENFKELGTSKLLAVPYALYAESAGANVVATTGKPLLKSGSTSQWTTLDTSTIQSDYTNVSIGVSEGIDRNLVVNNQIGLYGNTPGVAFKNVASSNKMWDISSSSNDLYFNETGISTAFTLKAGGNVGIGLVSPQYKLDVFGDINFKGKLYQDGNLFGGDEIWDNVFLNVKIGDGALNSNSSGTYNSAIGPNSLFSNSTGSFNIAIGMSALYNNTIGTNNFALGNYTLSSNTSGTGNVALGTSALQNNTTGNYNVATGFSALQSTTIGNYNVATGFNALNANTTGDQNIATGYRALMNNTIGYNNIATGQEVMHSNTSGFLNIATGYQTLYANTTGDQNIATGGQALWSNTTGNNNIAMGTNTLINNTSGNGNAAFGTNAGESITTGNSNIFIGINAGYHSLQKPDAVNSIAIGNNAYTTKDNQIVIGNPNTTETLLNGNLNFTGNLMHNGTEFNLGDSSDWVNDSQNNLSYTAGSVNIGTTTPDVSAKLDVTSATQGFLPPRMTTTQRNAITTPAVGLQIYNTTTNCLNFYTPNGWYEVCGTPIAATSTSPCNGVTSITDVDNNIYNTVEIGTQCWMKENLKTTTFNSYDAIDYIDDNTDWANLTTGAYCLYNNDWDNFETYGVLYNWYAVNDSLGLCPTGWHVPSYNDWTTLESYLGGSSVAGGKLKEAGAAHWASPNISDNSSGWTGLPGGFRYIYGLFSSINTIGEWWSSTEMSTTNSFFLQLGNGNATSTLSNFDQRYGMSVRCVKD